MYCNLWAIMADKPVDARIIGLQEIDNRAALQLLFPPQEWQIVIDDESGDDQDVALVVKKPLRILGVNPDLDADDQNFLFPSGVDDSSFPNRWDALAVEVQLPDQSESFFVIVVDAKSRFGGRFNYGNMEGVGFCCEQAVFLQQNPLLNRY